MIKVATPCMGKEEELAMIDVLYSGYYTSGPRVKAFEDAYAKYVGTKHAVGVSSGTAAIYLTLDSLGVREGDAVIVPSMTFFSTATAVLRLGAFPLFGDIDPETYNLCPYNTHEMLDMYEEIKAIIPVHFYGLCAEMDYFNDLGEDYKVHIVEDAAQAHGAEYKGRKAGSLADAATWSFFATKNMTTACEGGMITTDNEELADKARILRSHGMIDRDTHLYLGYNDRMDEIAAAIGLVQLRKLNSMNRTRIYYSAFLRENLKNVPWLKIPIIPEHMKHVFFWCNVEVDEDKLGMTTFDLRKLLYDKGIETRHRYWEPLYRQPILEKFHHLHSYKDDYCPNAERIAGKMLGLPNHPKLTKSNLNYIVEVIKSI